MEETLTFSEALELIKEGRRLARKGWNGKGMFIYHVGDWNFAERAVPEHYHSDPFIAMKTASETVVPWLASQSDILADDWMIA